MDIENVIEIEVDTSSESSIPTEIEKAGPAGLSAYQIAVKDGFIGTEEEWLSSLKGDRGETGATGQPGPQGLPGRDGAVQYTAGDNITIENNVISAEVPSIGLDTYIETAPIDTNGNLDWNQFPTQTWLLLPRDKNIGHYNTNNEFVAESGFYNLNKNGDTSIPHQIRLINIYYNKKLDDETHLQYKYQYVKLITLYSDPGYSDILTDGSSIKYYIKGSTLWTDNSSLPELRDFSPISSYVLTNKARTFAQKQTFSVLPESSVAPTSNNQLTNKKYVDTAITSAITTTLGGSY